MTKNLHKGDKVIAVGVLKPNSWTDKDTGTKRTDMVLQVDEIGVSPRHAKITTTKRQRGQRADTTESGGWANETPVTDDTPF